MGKTNLVVEPGKQEIWITREFDAPRELVFRAYTDPELLAKWWGPRYLTNDIKKLEMRSGGSWRIVQRAPDGGEHGFHGVCHSVIAPERIVQTFEYEGEPGHVVLETTTFEEHAGKTSVTSQSVFQSVADRDGMAAAGMESGMNEGFDRLDELIAERQKGGVLSR